KQSNTHNYDAETYLRTAWAGRKKSSTYEVLSLSSYCAANWFLHFPFGLPQDVDIRNMFYELVLNKELPFQLSRPWINKLQAKPPLTTIDDLHNLFIYALTKP